MLIDLDWLPQPAPDLRAAAARLEATLSDPPGDLFEQVVALASAAHDEPGLRRLARLSRAIAASPAASAFSRARVALVGDGTLSLVGSAVVGSGLRHGLLLEAVEGGYNSALQEALDPSSALHAARPDFVVIASDRRVAGLDVAAPDAQAAQARVEAAFSRLSAIAAHLRPSVGSAILVQTLTPPLEGLFGSFDRLEPTSSFSMVEALNRRIADWAATGEVVLLDIARAAGAVGLSVWEPPGHWHASKLSFAPEVLPLYGDLVARTLAAIRGRSRKCLVLDLDNTLWGGVVGDDGVAGLTLGQGSAVGEAHLAVQRMALELRSRGVVLAVCSKNEEDAARAPFREHPEMLLKEDHIAVFQANWTDKAANLRAIAQTLNIGVDALVFLDDNPAERAQVRRALPLVAVPEVGEDPADYPRRLAAAGYFEAVTFSDEDRARAGYYQANAQRAAVLSASGDLDAYLASLEMTLTIGPVDALTRPRVAQLINKSNQFNLTTRRYSEAEVEAAERDGARHVVWARLTDSFGDNGIISVLIADKRGEAWEIDTWLMSCRVLGRRVPEALLAHLVRAARAAGARRLVGRYIPSAKNRMVAGHYEGLGFTRLDAPAGATLGDGETLWSLDLEAYAPAAFPMSIDDRAAP